MGPEREQVVALFVAIIAILVIVGGYASFSGLATVTDPLMIQMEKTMFNRAEVFDVNILVSPVQFIADETIMVYVDGKAVGAIAIKKYLDDNDIDYGTEHKNLGTNNVEIITLMDPLTVNLADHISLEYTEPGTRHILKAEFSRGDASAEALFEIE